MKILFMGTSGFAVPSLKALIKAGHNVAGVVTQPDRPSGRGRKINVSPVKEAAVEAGIPVYQPERVKEESFVQTVREIAPDLIVVASFGQIIPKSILAIPPMGNVNVHASLLPKYRGAAPIHYALFNGDKVTGVTTMLMEPGLDTGPILLKREVEILAQDNQGTLEVRLADAGAELLLETIAALQNGTVHPTPQDDSVASYSHSVKREECQITWDESAQYIVNRVRGCNPRPGAYTMWRGSLLKIWEARPADTSSAASVPGEVEDVSSQGIQVRAGEGSVLLVEVQPEGKKRMQAAEFARGHQITTSGYQITKDKPHI
jgi:methionyl-tRNA formyltransferase